MADASGTFCSRSFHPIRCDFVAAFFPPSDASDGPGQFAENGRVDLLLAFRLSGRRVELRAQLSSDAAPREIDFIAALPKTPSGKIQRFILRGISPER